MGQDNWRDEWDAHASGEHQNYMDMPVAQLVENLRAGKLGDYHTIWNAIGKRASLQDIGWELYAFLQSDKDYLARYHCAQALLQMMQSKAFEPVDLSAKRGDQLAKNLEKLAQLLEEKIDPPVR